MFIHLILLAKITGSEVDLMTLARDIVFSAVVPVLFGEGILPQTHQEFKHFQKQFDQFDSNFEHGAKLPDFFVKRMGKIKILSVGCVWQGTAKEDLCKCRGHITSSHG